ncbi:MAG TPA: methylmalonyl-CoA mutase family protein [Syntrophorhabdaceae bacterium]|nr:methylmalonyl-CoA mutase family protein [Syntrophorhabdaceae bacterium]HQM81240.1 methylmalonyl-CoA mutase family protein [Syntrophorhabdaceae bacterium]
MMPNDKISEIAAKQKEWEEGSLKEYVKENPERDIFTEIPAKTLYTPVDRADSEYLRDIGFPGEYPYVRGITPTMYRSRIWPMSDYAGFGTAKETAERHKHLLAHGNTHMAVACDIPTQLGYDADDPLVEAEVGLIGVSLSSLKDVEDLLADIPLDRVTIRGSTSSLVLPLWAMYTVAAEKKGFPVNKMMGDAKPDVMDEYLGRGTYIFPPEHSLRLSLDLVEYGLKHIPNLTYQINSYTIHEQGSTVVQDGAYSLATALFYVEEGRKRGTIDVGEFAARISQHPAIHTHLFEEAAKSRAMRRLWARLIKERYNPANPKAMRCVIDPNTGGSVLTAQQAEINIIRIAMEILAAAMGGCTVIAPCSYDEALTIPTKKAVTMSLRAQQIIAYESGVCDTVDPLGGSYYVETLTDRIEKEMLDFINKIEAQGGMMEVIRSGWLKKEISRSAYLKQKALEDGRQVRVGLNKFCVEEDIHYEMHKPNPQLLEIRRKDLKKLRAERDSAAVRSSLEALRKAAQGTENLMPFLQDAVRNYATIGEITRVLKDVFGEYKPKPISV